MQQPNPITVAWSQEAGACIATTPVRPELHGVGATPVEALTDLLERVSAPGPLLPAGRSVAIRFERSFLLRRTQIWDLAMVPATLAGAAGPDLDEWVCDHLLPSTVTDDGLDDDQLTWSVTRLPAGPDPGRQG